MTLILSNLEFADIFNADKFALFYQALPQKNIIFKAGKVQQRQMQQYWLPQL